MTGVVQDLRYALRNVTRAPGFFVAALLTLGIGTGANATVFSFVNALLLRPVPGVADPGSLVSIYTSDFSSGPYAASSYPDYLSLREAVPAIAPMAAYSEGSALVRIGDTVERVRQMAVTPEFFDVIGVRAAIGRMLSAADFNAAAPGAVVADAFWRRTLGASPDALGSTIRIDDVPHIIVGIAPPAFTSLSISSFDVWIPLADSLAPRSERGDRALLIVGRLRDRLEASRTQVVQLAERLARDYPESNRGTLQAPDEPRPMTVAPLTRIRPAFRGQVLALTGVLMAAVALVLLIACANVASLMLARAASRRREVAIRLALGAGRRRVAQQTLTESLVLAAGGCAVGILFALWTSDVLPSFFPPDQARLLDAVVDMRVLAYTLAVSVLTALVFGLAPAAQAFRTPSVGVLRTTTGDPSGRGGGRVRRTLIAAQIALATVLLVSAGLLVRSFANALSADLGFDAREALLASVELPQDTDDARAVTAFRAALERVRTLPGVASASLTSTLPFSRASRRGFRIEGYEPRPGEDREFPMIVVDSAYFETLQIDVVAGRGFDEHDRAGAAPVVVVNALFADRFFGGQALGRRITDSTRRTMTVVGVVETGKYMTVQESVPTVYSPLAQDARTLMTLVVRPAGDALPLASAVRSAMTTEMPSAAVFAVRSLSRHVAEALVGERLIASLVATCGAVALLLALVGVYGVVSYAVGTRIREIGLRVALGAAPAAVVRLVLGEGVRVLASGLAVGIVAATVTAMLLRQMLYQIEPLDAATFGGVALTLVAATVGAAALPARRALAVDPMVALRDD